MKHIKHLASITALCLLLSACELPLKDREYGDHAQYIVNEPNIKLIYCSSQFNLPNEILYYDVEQVVNEMDLPQTVGRFSSYYITDVLGRVYSINSDEMDNYKCYEVTKAG